MTLKEFYAEKFGEDPVRLISFFVADIADMARRAGIVWHDSTITIPAIKNEPYKHKTSDLVFVTSKDRGRVYVSTSLTEVSSALKNRSESVVVPVISFNNMRQSVNYKDSWNGYHALWDAFNDFRRTGDITPASKSCGKVAVRDVIPTDEAHAVELHKSVWNTLFPMGNATSFDYLSAKGLAGLQKALPFRCGHTEFVNKEVQVMPGWNGSCYDFIAPELVDVRGNFVGYQQLFRDGKKRMNKGVNPLASFVLIGSITDKTSLVAICEGVATGGAIHKSTGWPVICVLFADNMVAVAEALADEPKYAGVRFVVIADNDSYRPDDGNKGCECACYAAAVLGCMVFVPTFDRFPYKGSPTDVDDLYLFGDIQEVRHQIKYGLYLTDVKECVAGAFCLI